MANSIAVTTIRPTDSFVTQTSRYANSTVLQYGGHNRLTFATYVRTVPVTSANDKFTVISPGYEFRPDLLSNDVYGIPDFWWKILEVNSIKDIFDFKAGITIRVPDIANIFS